MRGTVNTYSFMMVAMVFRDFGLEPSINLYSPNILTISSQLNFNWGKSTLTRPARGSSGLLVASSSSSSRAGILSSGGTYCFTTEFILPPAKPL